MIKDLLKNNALRTLILFQFPANSEFQKLYLTSENYKNALNNNKLQIAWKYLDN